MTEIKFKITDDIPVEIIKFELKNKINLIISRIKQITNEINSLQLTEEDKDLFNKARQDAWNKTKKKHGL